MKYAKLLIVSFVLIVCIILGVSNVSAVDSTNRIIEDSQYDSVQYTQVIVNDENNQLINESNDSSVVVGDSSNQVISENNDNCIYVNGSGGKDYTNNGTSWASATKTLNWALYLAKDNTTIYIADGTYSGDDNSKITITKSVNIIGSTNTVFNGLNKNYFFTISDGVTVSITNITFINALKKASSSQDKRSMFGGVLDVKNATVVINNCAFNNNRIEYPSSINKNNYGGAISNLGNMTIINSRFNGNSMASEATYYAYGSDVYNNGTLKIFDSTFKGSYVGDFAFGGSISNEGNLTLTRVVMSGSSAAQQTKGSVIYNSGSCTMINSTIKDSFVSRALFNVLYGVVYNAGKLVATGCIFTNNGGIAQSSIPVYKGTVNIYNVGEIDISYSAFLNNKPLSESYADFFEDGGQNICLDNNWWSTNENPFNSSMKINVNKVNSWLTLVGSPDYSALNINDSINISAIWKSSSGKPVNVNLIPIFDVSFNTWVNGTTQTITKKLANGSATINYNWTQKKGGYEVSITLGDFSQKVLIDVGKLQSNITVNVNNINYTETLVVDVNVSGLNSLMPTGNVSITINRNTYVEKLINGKATFNIAGLLAGNHTLNIVYMGDSEYARSFAVNNVTVNKCHLELDLSIAEIKVGETATIIAHITPKNVQIYARVYVNGIGKSIVVLNKEYTPIYLKNYGEGIYNITVETWGSELQERLYEMTSASGVLKISKYETNLTVNSSDVKVGENATITIKISPKDVKGEATIIINGEESKIFLNDEITNITLHDLSAGKYNVTVIYLGDSKYANSSASTSFSVLKESCNLTVDIVQNDNLTGVVNIKTNPNNCTGLIGVYVNNVFYQVNLVNGEAKILINFTKGTNYIYVYYPGDKYYDYASWNTTINITAKCILTGEDVIMVEGDGSKYTVKVTDLEGNPFTYVVVVLKVDGITYNVVTNNVGKASLPLNLTAGSYVISATYDYTTIYNNITVKALDFNLSVDDISYGEDAVIRANFNALINGSITFVIEDYLNKTVEVISGNASYTLSGLKLGTYTLEAIYNSKLSKTTTFVVSRATPKLNVDIKDVLAGQDEVITLTLPNDATGQAIFIVDGTTYTKTLNNGVATITIPNLTLGNHSLRVIYSGDSNYNNNSVDMVFNIKNSLSKTVIDVNNTVYGENIYVIASVTPGATGNVTFILGNITKTAELKNGKATAIFNNKLNAGNYSIKANYLGNSVYSKSSDEKLFNIAKANSHIEIITSEIEFNKNVRIWAIVNDDATGNVTFRILGLYSPRNKTIVNGNASWLISPLPSGSYVIVAVYNGDNNYLASNTSKVISLNQTRSVLKVDVEVGEEIITFTASLKTESGEAITGNVTLEVGNNLYKIVVVDGIGTRSIDKLPVGKYTYSATYKGTDKISRAIDSGAFEVKNIDYNVILTVPNVKMIYHDGTRLIATLTDKQGNPIENAPIEIIINGKTYDRKTDEKGVASLGLNLDSGIYSVIVKFKGLLNYTPVTKYVNVTIEPTVKGLDVVKMFRNDTQYYAIFTDSQGNVLKNKDITFNINGVFYTRTTDNQGIAKMTINLNPGKYVITAINTVTGEQSGNNITVKSLIIQKDLTKYYLNASRFEATIYNKDGSLATNKEVTFNINGVFYHRNTDEKGRVSMAINLRPGEYVITTMFDGLAIGNKVKILPTLITSNLNMKYRDGSSFTAQTLDGQGNPLAGQNISFNVNGVFYHRTTGSDGVAKLAINLMAGEYIITSYWGDFQTGNTIKIS